MKTTAWIVVATLAAVAGPWAAANDLAVDTAATEPDMQIVDAAQMLPFANLVNEVSPRRRRSVLAPNPLSMFDGVSVGYVQLSAGNLALRRRDLVGVALSPLVLDRVYDSRGDAGPEGDFGVGGWRLSLASHIQLDGASAVYINEAGARLALRRTRNRLTPLRPAPDAVAAIEVVDRRHIEMTGHNGSLRVFRRAPAEAVFRLVRVVDRFGNARRYAYDRGGRLRRVESGPRHVEFLRNPSGSISAVRDDVGRTLSYAYDRRGRLVAAIDAGGHPWHYHYDSQGRLNEVMAPGGHRDLGVTYDTSGKVSAVVHSGLERRYEYGAAANQPDGITVTRVIDSGGIERLFGHDGDGVTVWTQNAVGQRSRLWLTADYQPRLLQVDGQDTMRLSYDDQARLQHVLHLGDDPARGVSVRYGADGRPVAVYDASGAILAAIERESDHSVSVTGHGLHRRVASADDGAVHSAELAVSGELSFATSGAGQIVATTDSQGRAVAFEYAPAGQLAAVTFAGGERHAYRYDALGLRTATEISDGASVAYFYAPEGRIYRYEMTAPDGQRAVTSHGFDAHQRLIAIRQGDDLVKLRYRDDGALESIAPPGAELRFNYDALGRLAEAALERQTWGYRYRDGEVDLVTQAERRRSPAAFDPRYAAGELANVYSVLYQRRLPASHGVLSLDTRSGAFRLTHKFGVPLPGDSLQLALRAVGVLDADFQPAVFELDGDARSAFNAPSSFFFVPPEYWALNCVICPGHYPRPAPPSRAPPPAWPTLESAFAALEHTCYLFPYTVPEPICRVVVSGLPEYLCMGDTMTIGAWLTPATLQPDNLSWSTNDFLVVQPVGATGTPVSLLGAPGTPTVTSGVGTVRGVYSGGGVFCSSATESLNVIAERARNYTQLTDLDMCPERQQDTLVPHEIDGCSIPPLLGDLLFSGDVQDPLGGTHYAAGHPTTFGVDEGTVPFGAAPAPLPCNRHDVCYQTCGHNRLGCDNAFNNDMRDVCDLAYPETCPYGFATPACAAFEVEKLQCLAIRAAIFQGVRAGGNPSYRQRQVQHCRCCP